MNSTLSDARETEHREKPQWRAIIVAFIPKFCAPNYSFKHGPTCCTWICSLEHPAKSIEGSSLFIWNILEGTYKIV